MAVGAVISYWRILEMQLKVLYFATFRDRTGLKEETLSLPGIETVADLKKELGRLHPEVEAGMPTALVSINREFAFPEDEVHEGDEIAFFPPVSGGVEPPVDSFQITEEPLDLNELVASIVSPTTGAACVFTGVVRGQTLRDTPHETSFLEYESYEPMAEEKMRQVAAEIREQWASIEGIAMVQRIGKLDPGTPTVLIACSAGHRDTGVFEAARYGIDRLKEIVPVWKKEVSPNGEEWIEGKYTPTQADQS
jgi:MoaE-MoaD fusion protein